MRAKGSVSVGSDASRRRALRGIVASIGSSAAVASLMRCGPAGSGTPAAVTVYASADDVLAREVLAACESRTGIRTAAVFDTEATKTTGLENRIRSEMDRPRADIFWSSESFAVARLAAAGALAELSEEPSKELWSRWPAAYRDPDRRWLAFAARARVVVHREGTDPVRAWSELSRAGLPRGSRAAVAIADPRFGTTSAHLSALRSAWSHARDRGVEAPSCEDWLEGLARQGCLVLPGGNAATVDAVAAGECAYGITDTDDAFAAIARGLPLAWSLPRSLPAGIEGGGTMVVANTVALVRGGPGARSAAESVARFLVSPESELRIARSPSRNLPLGPAVDRSDPSAQPFDEPDPLRYDAAAAATDGARFSRVAHAILTRAGGAAP